MRASILLPISLLLASCKPHVVAPPPPVANDPHPESANVQAASLVGYDGKALKTSVDGVSDANAKHNQEIQDAADGK